MTYSKIVLTNEEGYDLEISYNSDESTIMLSIDDGSIFTIRIKEWDSFIAELNKIKSLLIPEQ